MHEQQRSRVLSQLLDKTEVGGENKSYTKERQHTAQALTLHVQHKHGRHAEGFGWAHYVGYDWRDDGTVETLVVVFTSRLVEIKGHNLNVLVGQIRDGQLNGVYELESPQLRLLENGNQNDEPIISSVKSYPDFEDILREIKGEDDDKPRHAKRAAGR
jgi:hypothetical protein